MRIKGNRGSSRKKFVHMKTNIGQNCPTTRYHWVTVWLEPTDSKTSSDGDSAEYWVTVEGGAQGASSDSLLAGDL